MRDSSYYIIFRGSYGTYTRNGEVAIFKNNTFSEPFGQILYTTPSIPETFTYITSGTFASQVNAKRNGFGAGAGGFSVYSSSFSIGGIASYAITNGGSQGGSYLKEVYLNKDEYLRINIPSAPNVNYDLENQIKTYGGQLYSGSASAPNSGYVRIEFL